MSPRSLSGSILISLSALNSVSVLTRYSWKSPGKALVTQWPLTLCNSMDYSPPASSDHGIPQARACVSLWQILVDVWQKTIQFWKAIILQLKKFFFKEYWSGLPFPSPGDLPDPGIELRSPALQVDALPAELLRKPRGTAEGKPNGVLCPGSFLLIWGEGYEWPSLKLCYCVKAVS